MFSKCAFHRFVIFTMLLSVTFFVFSGCEKIKVVDVIKKRRFRLHRYPLGNRND